MKRSRFLALFLLLLLGATHPAPAIADMERTTG